MIVGQSLCQKQMMFPYTSVDIRHEATVPACVGSLVQAPRPHERQHRQAYVQIQAIR